MKITITNPEDKRKFLTILTNSFKYETYWYLTNSNSLGLKIENNYNKKEKIIELSMKDIEYLKNLPPIIIDFEISNLWNILKKKNFLKEMIVFLKDKYNFDILQNFRQLSFDYFESIHAKDKVKKPFVHPIETIQLCLKILEMYQKRKMFHPKGEELLNEFLNYKFKKNNTEIECSLKLIHLAKYYQLSHEKMFKFLKNFENLNPILPKQYHVLHKEVLSFFSEEELKSIKNENQKNLEHHFISETIMQTTRLVINLNGVKNIKKTTFKNNLKCFFNNLIEDQQLNLNQTFSYYFDNQTFSLNIASYDHKQAKLLKEMSLAIIDYVTTLQGYYYRPEEIRPIVSKIVNSFSLKENLSTTMNIEPIKNNKMKI